jgi:integrase
MAYKRSNIPNLYVDLRSGIYTVRTKSQGKTLWRSLETTSYSVAKLRTPKLLAELQRGRLSDYAVSKGVATFGDLAEKFRQSVLTNTRLKPSSKAYRIQTINAILRERKEWKDKSVREIKESDCQQWAISYFGQVHGSRFNNTVSSLRSIFEIGLQSGLIAENPTRKISKARVHPKDVVLPTAEQFALVLKCLEEGPSWSGPDSADMIRFLAFSGCRVSEARNVKKSDVDLVAGTLRIRGDPIQGTKSGRARSLPLNPSLRELVTRLLQDEREPKRGRDFLLMVGECRRPLASACYAAGVQILGHHSMRHYFVTKAIQNGIDVPTISRWIGHQDGGGLLLRTYSHLMSDHSNLMASKMTF